MTYTATYSPDDNKLRLSASSRLDAETYAEVKGAGFRWAPKQEVFFTTWHPAAEDVCVKLAGEIDDDDQTLLDRAEDRAGRFEDYSEKRQADGNRAAKVADTLAGAMQGQPILVGHHSEKRHRRDIARMQDASSNACKLWRTSEYWTHRAAAAVRHAKYKELPAVRARRIKGLEADERKQARNEKQTEMFLRLWSSAIGDDSKWKADENGLHPTMHERAVFICNRDHVSRCFPLADFPREPPASQYEGMMDLWSALGGSHGPEHAVITWEQARDIATAVHERYLVVCRRWLAHYRNRLAYERGMLAEQGGIVADRVKPEVGGGVYCWATRRRGADAFSYIAKVNKVSVSVWDNWGNGGANFLRTMPFDKLARIISRADVAAARERGDLIEFEDKTGFFIAPAATHIEEA